MEFDHVPLVVGMLSLCFATLLVLGPALHRALDELLAQATGRHRGRGRGRHRG